MVALRRGHLPVRPHHRDQQGSVLAFSVPLALSDWVCVRYAIRPPSQRCADTPLPCLSQRYPLPTAEEHDKLPLEKRQAIVESCPTKVYKLDERENVRRRRWRVALALPVYACVCMYVCALVGFGYVCMFCVCRGRCWTRLSSYPNPPSLFPHQSTAHPARARLPAACLPASRSWWWPARRSACSATSAW